MKTSNIQKNFDFLNENLASANFAMVMSTGIVSVALHLLGCNWGAYLLKGTMAKIVNPHTTWHFR